MVFYWSCTCTYMHSCQRTNRATESGAAMTKNVLSHVVINTSIQRHLCQLNLA